MNRELIEQRLETLGDALNKCEAGSEQAAKIKQEIMDLWKMLLEDEKVDNERLDRNRRFDLEEMKYELDIRQTKNESRKSVVDSILGVVKIAASVGGAFAMLIFTLVIEDKTIISQKAWSIIGKFVPKMLG